jgi:hypothetical protein
MAKICPLTGETVLYLTCNECEDKIKCRELSKNKVENKSNLKDFEDVKFINKE